MNILAISGSLRAQSSCTATALLRAAAIIAPAGITVRLYTALGDLPPFNPDRETGGYPIPAVLHFRRALQDADALLICSPEYAHGVSGVLKNALDWLVGSGDLSGTPVALLNAAPWAGFSHNQLAETIKTMDARFIDDASVAISLLPKTLDAAGIAVHPKFAPALRSALETLVRAVEQPV